MMTDSFSSTLKYFILADIHWQKKTLERLNETFNWIHEELYRHKPERILILGDTFQHRNSIDIQVQDAASIWIEKFLEAPWHPTIHFLVGNHDMIDLDDRKINSVNVFQHRHSRIFIHSELEVINLDGHDYIMAPYHHDQAPIAQYLNQHRARANNIVVLGHLAVDSTVMYGATDRSQRLCTDSGLTINQLSIFKRVFMGHFHFHKSYADNKVVYVGSPIQTDFGEAGNIEKGYILFMPNENVWNLKASPFASYYLNWTWEHFQSLDEASLRTHAFGKAIQIIMREQEFMTVSNRTRQEALSSLQLAGASQQKIKRITSLPPTRQQNNSSTPQGTAESQSSNSQLHSQPSAPLLPSFDELLDRFVKQTNIEETEQHTYMANIIANNPPSLQNSSSHSFEGKLKCISIQYFLSVQATQVLDFSNLQSSLYLLKGYNGHGKSTLLDAICWCLFGKTMRGISGDKIICQMNDVANNIAKNKKGKTENETAVVVTFANGTVITRRRKMGGKEKLDVCKNGTDKTISRGSIKETTNYLSQLIGIDFETFVRTCMINGKSLEAIFSPDSSKKDQNFMELILSLPIHHYWQICANEMKKCSKTVTELDERLKSTIFDLQSTYEKYRETENLLTEKWVPQLQQAQGKLAALEAQCSQDVVIENDIRHQLNQSEASMTKYNARKQDYIYQQNSLRTAKKRLQLIGELETLKLNSDSNEFEACNENEDQEKELLSQFNFQTEILHRAKEALRIQELRVEQESAAQQKRIQDLSELRNELVQLSREQKQTAMWNVSIAREEYEKACHELQSFKQNQDKLNQMRNKIKDGKAQVQDFESARVLKESIDVYKSQQYWSSQENMQNQQINKDDDVLFCSHMDEIASKFECWKDLDEAKIAVSPLINLWKASTAAITKTSTFSSHIMTESPIYSKEQCQAYFKTFNNDESESNRKITFPLSLQQQQCLERYNADTFDETKKKLNQERGRFKQLKSRLESFDEEQHELDISRKKDSYNRHLIAAGTTYDPSEVNSATNTRSSLKNLDDIEANIKRCETHIEHLQLQIQTFEKHDLKTILHDVNKNKEKIQTVTETLKHVRKRLLYKQIITMEISIDNEHISLDVIELDTEFIKLENTNRWHDSIIQLEEQIAKLKAKERELDEISRNHQVELTTCRNHIEWSKVEIETLQSKLLQTKLKMEESDHLLTSIKQELEAQDKELMLATFWTQQLMQGANEMSFRQYCVCEPLKYVNSMIAANMCRLTERDIIPDPNLDCRINTKLKLEQDHLSRELAQRSSGQVKRNQLATFFTLFLLFREQQIFKSHFIFFDETLESLDLPGSQSLLSWLKEEAESLNITMFMITHHVEVFETLPNVIHVTKDVLHGTSYKIGL